MEDRTVDVLRVGEMQPERDHEFTGERIFTGDSHNRKWRTARDSGYFAFTMKVDPSDSNTLVCTYWGEDNRGRTFDILVNDTRIATEDLTKYKMSKFYDIGYPIPKELTRQKSSVLIKFVPKKNNSAGPVYGVRMVKGDLTGLTTPLSDESIYRPN